MNEQPKVKESTAAYTVVINNLKSPLILEHKGQPVAAVISIEDYEHYQTLLKAQQKISAKQARRAANHAFLGDLVGCALSIGEPEWHENPKPHWRVPYKLLNGIVFTTIKVDAYTGRVALTQEQRDDLLKELEQRLSVDDYA